MAGFASLIPRLLVRKAVWHYIRKETFRFPLTETCWGLFGYLLADGRIYLAGYIPPLAGCIQRSLTGTVLGGERLGDAVMWLRVLSNQLNSHSNAEFAELYEGHSHHQLGISGFSKQDVLSMVTYVRDNPSIKAAIGTLSMFRPVPLESPDAQNKYGVPIRFYFYSRDMCAAGVGAPVLCTQIEIVADVPGITVPELGWQFLGEVEYQRQLVTLQTHGYQVQVLDCEPPIVSWFIRKPTWNKGYMVLHIPLRFPTVAAELDVFRADHPRLSEIVPGADFLPVIQCLDQEVLTHAAPPGWRTP